MKVKRLGMLLMVVFAVGVIIIPAATSAAKPYELRFGIGAPTTSSTYSIFAKCNEVVNSSPKLRSTMLGTSAAMAAMREMYAGNAEWGGLENHMVWYESLNGLGKWKGQKQKNTVRVLIEIRTSHWPIFVRKETGITTIEQLEGKKFAPGFPGSQTYNAGSKSLEALGIKYKEFVGSLSDMVAAMKDKRIVGYMKATKGRALDASHYDVLTSCKLQLVPISDADKSKIQAKYPFIEFKKLPAGYYKDFPNLPEVQVHSAALFLGVSSRVPEDIVYEMTKVLVENWGQIKKTNPSLTDDPLETAGIITGWSTPVYLHPGAAKYYRERGVDIATSILPPK